MRFANILKKVYRQQRLEILIYGYGYRDNGVGELVDSMLVNNRLYGVWDWSDNADVNYILRDGRRDLSDNKINGLSAGLELDNDFGYDQLNRLRSMSGYLGQSGNAWSNKLINYGMSVSYDRNGNILRLGRRYGGVLLDSLIYGYGYRDNGVGGNRTLVQTREV